MSNATFTQIFGPFAAGVSSAGLQSAGVDQIELHRGSGWLHARLLLDHFVAFEEIEQAERAVAKGLALSSVEFRPLYPADALCVECFPTIVSFLRRRCTAVNGTFRDAACRIDGETMTVTLRHGGLNVLKATKTDAAMGALLLGDDGMETEFDHQAFRRLDLSRIHRFPCQIAPGYLRIRQTFQNRSEALFKGCHLAFLKRNAGEVVLETEGEEGIIRKPEVVSFAWKHWKDKTLYSRFLERGTVVSPDIRALARLHDLDGFASLRATASMTAELGRDFCLRFSPAVIDSLGRGLSVYLCGPYLALWSDGEGDIQVREKEGRGLVYAPRLYQQLTMRYPGSSRLFLIPHGNFLVFSETETCESLPPEDYFCRLLVSRERSAHLMRYGAAL